MHNATITTSVNNRIKDFRSNPDLIRGPGARFMTEKEVETYGGFVEDTFELLKAQDNTRTDRDERQGRVDSYENHRVGGFSGTYIKEDHRQGEYSDTEYNVVDSNQIQSHSGPHIPDQNTTVFNYGRVEDGFIVGANYKVVDNTLSGTEFHIDRNNPQLSVILETKPSTARGV